MFCFSVFKVGGSLSYAVPACIARTYNTRGLHVLDLRHPSSRTNLNHQLLHASDAHELGADRVEFGFVGHTIRIIPVEQGPKALTVVHFGQVRQFVQDDIVL